MLKLIRDYLDRVAGSYKGILIPEELARSILTSLGSGSFIGLLLSLCQAILIHAAIIFPNPIVASLATMLLTLIIDLIRRLNQGDKPPSPIPTPPPTPAPPMA